MLCHVFRKNEAAGLDEFTVLLLAFFFKFTMDKEEKEKRGIRKNEEGQIIFSCLV